MIEVELRFPVKEFQDVKNNLLKLGGVFVNKKKQNDIYFRHILDKEKRWIVRIRNSKLLTVKTGVEGKWNEEEIVVDSPKNKIIDFLEALGFEQVLKINKERHVWKLRDTVLNLDSIEGLGNFVEIEGESWGKILDVSEKIGLDKSKAMREGYVRMFKGRET